MMEAAGTGRHPSGVAGDEVVPSGAEVLRVEGLVKYFPWRNRPAGRAGRSVRAVDGISLSLNAGETLGLVGESGSGKTTVGRTVARLYEPSDGRIVLDGRDISHLSERDLHGVRRDIQMVFQDPFGSLNPRMRTRDIVAEPLRVHGVYKSGGKARVEELFGKVGLRADHGDRYPHELSGGERQRIAIARALALNPKCVVLDEPTSALDVSVQAQIINLLQDLQAELGLAYLLISHDLGVIRHICDRVSIMYLGQIVENGTTDEIYESARHPYTQALLSAEPSSTPERPRVTRRIVLAGEMPSPTAPPSGCRFRTRCWKADEMCAEQEPVLELRSGAGNHPVKCHHPRLE